MSRKKTYEEVLEDFHKAHGDKYDYSLVKYIHNDTPVNIICHKRDKFGKEHGKFLQTPHNHKRGCGCPICAIENNATRQRKSNEENITIFKNIHGKDRYDYSKWDTKDAHELGIIICHKRDEFGEEHGEFLMSSASHKSGHGCPKCSKNAKLTNEDFINKAQLKHGNKYDYSLVSIVGNNSTSVSIICRRCGGIFKQIINNHLNGEGCPHCNYSKLEIETEKQLRKHGIYFIPQMTFEWMVSIKNRRMSLDFYIPYYNIGIECQGIQHYEHRENSLFTETVVSDIQQRDKLKYQLCQEHSIPIFYIRYDDNVENKVNEVLNSLRAQKEITDSP